MPNCTNRCLECIPHQKCWDPKVSRCSRLCFGTKTLISFSLAGQEGAKSYRSQSNQYYVRFVKHSLKHKTTQSRSYSVYKHAEYFTDQSLLKYARLRIHSLFWHTGLKGDPVIRMPFTSAVTLKLYRSFSQFSSMPDNCRRFSVDKATSHFVMNPKYHHLGSL